MRAGTCEILYLHTEDFYGFRPALISAYYGKPDLWSGFSRFRSPALGGYQRDRPRFLFPIRFSVNSGGCWPARHTYPLTALRATAYMRVTAKNVLQLFAASEKGI